uniref:Polynucleotide kinase n=1 Tax=viral metagenome TaxID=1070528 RepID=A0A6M3LPU0_9ZZZZ
MVEQEQGWIGVDLDGTLAEYHRWVAANHIGEPIPKMMARVKEWLAEGKRIKIFTARAGIPEQTAPIGPWLKKHGLPDLEITNVKDFKMIALWDDRCVRVEPNTGRRLDLDDGLIKEITNVLKDAVRTMRTYGTDNMGFSIDRCNALANKIMEEEE